MKTHWDWNPFALQMYVPLEPISLPGFLAEICDVENYKDSDVITFPWDFWMLCFFVGQLNSSHMKSQKWPFEFSWF